VSHWQPLVYGLHSRKQIQLQLTIHCSHFVHKCLPQCVVVLVWHASEVSVAEQLLDHQIGVAVVLQQQVCHLHRVLHSHLQ